MQHKVCAAFQVVKGGTVHHHLRHCGLCVLESNGPGPWEMPLVGRDRN